MREIKFRGQRIDSIQWVYGHYFENKNYDEHIIMERKNAGYQTSEVYPETIGQYTGLKDRNGKEIFEGDIDKSRFIVTYVDSSRADSFGMSIGFYIQRDDFESWAELKVGDEIEVIGNIHENPELLGVI